MFHLKLLSHEGVPAAIEKAVLYRQLNEPEQAESICLDVLGVEPDHQKAIITLILSVTDRFGDARPVSPQRARELLPRLHGEYEREYYAGIVYERLGLARLRAAIPGSGRSVYELFRKAMAHYERAERLRPPANDDPILRWNCCARMIDSHPDVEPEDAEELVGTLGE